MKNDRTLSRILTASSIGTILEWYDFALFAYLTPTLAKLFFPKENALTALMLTYAIFAVGYFVRPIGAAIFGHIGDRSGRKKTLVWSILLMSLPTFGMGLLPTYQTIGMAAPILLIILRICQGLSAGGETTGSILFTLESVDERRRGFIGGLIWSMVGVGMLLGSLAATLVSYDVTHPWIWRVPFLLGIVTGLIGYFLRKYTIESAMFMKAAEEGKLKKFPLVEGIVKYKKEMGVTIGLYILSAMITYLIFVFMPSYAHTIIGMPLDKMTLISTIMYLIVTVLVPVGGYLSDKIGRRTSLRWSAFGFILLSYPLFQLIAQGSITQFIVAEFSFVMLAVVFQGALNATVFELFPTAVRYSVVAVGYNVSYSLFGGTAPFVATSLANLTGDKSAPGLYLVAGACIAFVATSKLQLQWQKKPAILEAT